MKATVHRPSLPLLAAMLLSGNFLAGCGGEGTVETLDVTSAALLSSNGKSMNGKSMNGKSMNGTSLTGLFVTQVALVPAVGANKLTDVVLSASVFSSAKAKLSGAGFVGAVWTATLSNGSSIPLTAAAIGALPAPNADLTGYAMTYPTADLGLQPLCGLEADGTPVLAVPLAGTWNFGQGVTGGGDYTSTNNSFTFACRHAAIAKCVELGYKPWLSGGGAMQSYLTTCTRVLRADYCGNGSSYTVDGTVIDLYDNFVVQADATPTWPVEAQWHPGGAACITPGTYDRFSLAGLAAPPCYAKKTTATSTCGDGGFTTINGRVTRMINRFQP